MFLFLFLQFYVQERSACIDEATENYRDLHKSNISHKHCPDSEFLDIYGQEGGKLRLPILHL